MSPQKLLQTLSDSDHRRSLNDVTLGAAVYGLLICGVLGIVTWIALILLAFDGGWAILPLASLPLLASVLAFGALLFALRRGNGIQN